MLQTHLDQQSKLARDVTKFMKSLQIPKQQSEWVVDDEDISESERSGTEDNEEDTNDTPLVTSEVAPAKGNGSRYVCTKLDGVNSNSDLSRTALSSNPPLVFSTPASTTERSFSNPVRIYNRISIFSC